MASEWTPDHPDDPAEPQITVVVHRSAPSPLRRGGGVAVVVAALLAVIGVVAISGLPGGGSRRATGVPGAGGSFGYPFRCLSIAFAPDGSGTAHAYVQHGGLCGRYARYVSATFRRVDGSWRLIGR
jgi:hypothetical protein